MASKNKFLVVILIIWILSISAFSCARDNSNKTNNGIDFTYESLTCNMTVIRELETEIITNEDDAIAYYSNSQYLVPYDENGLCTDTPAGRIMEKYNSKYFNENILIIIPTAASPANHVYNLKEIYLEGNVLVVIRENVPKDWIHTTDVGGVIYYVEIKKNIIKADMQNIAVEYCVRADYDKRKTN